MTRSFLDAAASPREQRAAQLLATAATVPPRPLDRAGWEAVLERAAHPRRDPRLLPAFAASVTLGVLVMVGVQRWSASAPREVAPVVVVTAQTRWHQTAPGTLQLERGRLSVTPGTSPVRVETPFATFSASRAAFLAEVVDGHAELFVESGEVEVRLGTARQTVHAGERFRWPDLPASLLVAPVLDARCSDLACLEQEAQGESLDAQSALYELGALRARQADPEGAVAAWRESLRRFPDGVLAPEVRIALFVSYVSTRRLDEARAMATELEACCGEDPRVVEVRRVVGP